jgi:hypothetical protein
MTKTAETSSRSSGKEEQPELRLGIEGGANSYRCPGCGEMFRNENIEEILFHHQHALDAYRFAAAPLGLQISPSRNYERRLLPEKYEKQYDQ